MGNLNHIFDYGSLFNGLSKEEKHALILAEYEKKYEKGKVIYKDGGKATELYCLVEGRVKIYKEGMDRKQVIRLVRCGGFFGYRPYFIHQKYTLTAEAMTPVRVKCVKLYDVKKILDKNPTVAMNFVKDLSDRLGLIDARLVSLTQKHIRGRMADALIMIMETYGREWSTGLLNCAMSREEIANLANMTTASGIKVLAAFRDEGVIDLVAKRIRIVNEMQLRKISAMG